MPEYDNNNSGAIFKNDKKQTDKHPDYRGSAEVDGVEYWVSAWIKTSKAGAKFMSLSFTVKDEQKQAAPPQQQQPFVPVKEADLPF